MQIFDMGSKKSTCRDAFGVGTIGWAGGNYKEAPACVKHGRRRFQSCIRSGLSVKYR